jgi:serine/threonine protein kinase
MAWKGGAVKQLAGTTQPNGPAFLSGGRFELVRLLGRGGMGAVYEVFDRERNIPLALKTLLAMGPRAIETLKNEFRALADVHHPNLVTLGELLERDGSWFFTMELVRGTDFLRHVCPGAAAGPGSAPVTPDGNDTVDTATLSRGSASAIDVTRTPRAAYDEARLRDTLVQLAAGLGALHAAGKVHRDIKPSNILVTADGRLVLLDFGIAADAEHELTAPSTPMTGTVAYMAPEQIEGGRVGPEADCYAIGVLLYQALTGVLPFRGTQRDILAAKCSVPPTPPGELVPGLPPHLETLCMQLLARAPDERPRVGDILCQLGHSEEEPSTTTGSSQRLFVGRRDELERLQDALARTGQGQAVAAFVCGESGLGKSALLRECLRRAHAQGALVLHGRCYEREAVPYKGVDSLIDALATHLSALPASPDEVLPADAALLPALFPVLLRAPAIAALPVGAGIDDPHLLRRRAFLALRALLATQAKSRRLILAIDDLQWTDGDSLALLATLLEPPAVPFLLLCSVRTEPGNPAFRSPQALAAALAHPVEMLPLGRLGDHEARELLANLERHATGDGSVDPATILAEAEGHPLFLDTLLRFRRSRSAAGTGPVRLEDALRARLERLPAAARNLLEIVSLFARPLGYELAAAATALPLDEIER